MFTGMIAIPIDKGKIPRIYECVCSKFGCTRIYFPARSCYPGLHRSASVAHGESHCQHQFYLLHVRGGRERESCSCPSNGR